MAESSAWAAPQLSALWDAQLPDRCDPTSPFLYTLSAWSHSCIPNPLAFVSVLLGTLSIVSWLFAQLPQIVKNFRLRSSSGLSIFFLSEWLLGDISNLVGAVLTHQATWQVIIGAYYCFVDVCLVGQWLWYERLRHGRPLKSIWMKKYRRRDSGHDGEAEAVLEGVDSAVQQTALGSFDAQKTAPRAIDEQAFRFPNYKDSKSAVPSKSPSKRMLARTSNNPLPSPSPRTILFISLLLAVCSRASPVEVNDSARDALVTASSSALDTFGTVISWCSTMLYLGSRLPQLVKNARLRSTAGLSPLLFLAAFCGNLFYSTSMLCNPLAWSSYGPYGGDGWAPAEGSRQKEWVANAMPFFLGAAGVLIMDASIGVQFILFRETRRDEDIVIVVEDDDQTKPGGTITRHMRKVSGWMRGWSPAFGTFTSPPGSEDGASERARSPSDEERRLLHGECDVEGGTYGTTR